MLVIFYLTAALVVAATVLAISRSNIVHGLLYLVVALLGTAILFFMLGAPFAAALEVIIYAGAIVVLFLFAVMMLDLGSSDVARERRLLRPRLWLGPGLLAAGLAALLAAALLRWPGLPPGFGVGNVSAQLVSRTLLGPYLIGVELASMLLLAALVAAYHLSRDPAGPAVQPPRAPASSAGGDS